MEVNYFEEDDLRGKAIVPLTEDQSPADMARMLVESFGVDHCEDLASALSQRVRAAQVAAQMRAVAA